MTTTVPVSADVRLVTLDISNDPNKPNVQQFHLVDVSGHDIRCKVTASEGSILDVIELRVLAFFYPTVSKVWALPGQRLDEMVHFHGVGKPKFRDAVADPVLGMRIINRSSVILPVESSGVYTVDWL
jgi:hypothetical protein